MRRTDDKTRVTIVDINVTKESINGNIELVAHHRLACSYVPGTSRLLEVAKTIMSIKILPIKPEIIAQRELRAISAILIFCGPNVMCI